MTRRPARTRAEALIEDGDRRPRRGGRAKAAIVYAAVAWEEDRVADPERTRRRRRSSRRSAAASSSALYNQKEVWPIFGYEGEFLSKGGYIERGFDDIEWL